MVKLEINERFEQNLGRVKGLISLYETSISGQGRRDVLTTDILRAAVVFLHATLEDFLRSLLEWRLPMAKAEYLKDIPLEGRKPGKGFTLDDLAPYRGKTIDDVITSSVVANLEKSNYNHPGEIEGVLESIGLVKTLLDPYRGKLGPMMLRRHWIVHRADRNTASGSGHHSARALDRESVKTWLEALENFGKDILSRL